MTWLILALGLSLGILIGFITGMAVGIKYTMDEVEQRAWRQLREQRVHRGLS